MTPPLLLLGAMPAAATAVCPLEKEIQMLLTPLVQVLRCNADSNSCATGMPLQE